MARPLETLAQAVQRVRDLPQGAPEAQRQATVLAVVLDCSLPRPSRGSDSVVNMRVMDASCTADEGMQGGVELIVFSRDVGAMPQAAAQADIIRLQNVLVQSWGGRAQLLGQLNPHRPFSYLMFGGTLGASDVPYRMGGGREAAWQVGPDDVSRLAQLRRLSSQLRLTGSEQGNSVYLRKVMDLKLPPLDGGATAFQQQQQQQQQPPLQVHGPGEVLDMRCKVLAIDRRVPAEPVLFMWDSTDALPMPRNARIQPGVFRGRDELRATPRARLMPLVPGEAGVEVLSELPPMGTALPVVVPQPRNQPPFQLPSLGDWVKLKVVGVQLHQGQLVLAAGPCSRILPSSKDPHFDAAWAARQAANDTAVFATPPVTRCPGHQGLPLVTVRQVLLRRLEGVGRTFRLRARVTGHVPEDPAAFCRRRRRFGDGGGSGGSGTWAYAAKLRLEDATGALDALLLGRHAQALLGPPPCDLGASPQELARVARSLAQLTNMPPSGVGKDGEGCAWVEVVVSSCYSEAAAAAASDAAAAAAGSNCSGLLQGGAAGARSEASEASALNDRSGCVYVIHDTFGVGGV